MIARGGDAGRLEAALAQVSSGSELPNAASAQATIGAESWAPLGTHEVILTPRAVELLAEGRGEALAGTSYRASPGMAAMMATILNLLTFNRDFARRAIRRELTPRRARGGWAGFLIDTLVTAFTAVPVALLTLVLEGAAILARRGGVMRAELSRRASRAPG